MTANCELMPTWMVGIQQFGLLHSIGSTGPRFHSLPMKTGDLKELDLDGKLIPARLLASKVGEAEGPGTKRLF